VLAAVGGRYEWSTLPCVIAAAALFLASGARVAADSSTRPLDIALIAALAVIALQLLPLPPGVLAAVSPAARNLQDAYALEPAAGWRPITIHSSVTRTSLALALAAAFVFWASREAFTHGGTQAAIRLLAWVGFACSLVSLAQRATAPTTIYWRWRLADPRAMPFGPFVDRNQLATWLVLTVSVVTGYLVMRVRMHLDARAAHGWRASLVALSDGDSLGILGCLAAMLITLAATLSRSGFVALIASVTVGTTLARRDRRQGLRLGAAAAVALLAVAAWLNAQGLVQRVQSTLDAADGGRLAIWRETLHIIRDFPITGTGAGTFAEAMFIYQRTATQVLFNHAHDEYLQLLEEGGVMLLIVLFAGLVFLVRTARERLQEDDGPYRFIRIGACAALAAIAVQNVWETGLRAPANLLLAAILAALAVRPRRRRESAEETAPA
jgi:O-antigen ligase